MKFQKLAAVIFSSVCLGSGMSFAENSDLNLTVTKPSHTDGLIGMGPWDSEVRFERDPGGDLRFLLSETDPAMMGPEMLPPGARWERDPGGDLRLVLDPKASISDADADPSALPRGWRWEKDSNGIMQMVPGNENVMPPQVEVKFDDVPVVPPQVEAKSDSWVSRWARRADVSKIDELTKLAGSLLGYTSQSAAGNTPQNVDNGLDLPRTDITYNCSWVDPYQANVTRLGYGTKAFVLKVVGPGYRYVYQAYDYFEQNAEHGLPPRAPVTYEIVLRYPIESQGETNWMQRRMSDNLYCNKEIVGGSNLMGDDECSAVFQGWTEICGANRQ